MPNTRPQSTPRGAQPRPAALRRRLNERYHRLIRITYGIAGCVNDSADIRDEPPSRISVDSYEEEVTHQVSEICVGEMHEIEEALRRISEGEYGQCEDCGGRIPPARLKAMPSASVCVECQEKREWRRQAEGQDGQADGCYASLSSAMAQMAMD